ncbi:MAG: metalloregulator ArsR/SmtB family transcription factor, partial [Thermomicrobiales bacterium]|nr:metalloregulator ArsR/SmtB family transcription factor [Thermomicrobiales bacterium]
LDPCASNIRYLSYFMIIEFHGGRTMEPEGIERVATLFKALADPARLRILGLLAERPRAGHELADELALTPPTISHHMRKLADAGLVAVTPEAQSRIYSLRTDDLRELASTVRPPTHSEDTEDARVIRAFFDGERLKQIPAQRKKRVVILRHLLTRFAPGQGYSEREINDMLRVAHEDVATLRRELVDYGFMTRDKGIYRVATELPARGATVAQEVGNEAAWFEHLLSTAAQRAIKGTP